MSKRKQLYCLEHRLDEHETYEVAETLIANAIDHARRPQSRLGIGLDIVATPEQIRTGSAQQMAEHLLHYMAEEYPELFAAYIGVTDNPQRLPMRGLTAERLSEADIDDVHLFVYGGYRESPTAASQSAQPPDELVWIAPDPNVVY